MAAGLGVLTPFCSCSAVPLFIGFVEAGIPLGVTFSFLIASPMINEVAVVILLGILGWKLAILYVAAGLLVALAGCVSAATIVNGFVGTFREQIRVVGEATSPQAMLYNDSMTLLDVMVRTGGVTDFADGNNSILVRVVDGNQEEFRLRLNDLIRDGDITANVDMRPGDIIIIPEAWF